MKILNKNFYKNWCFLNIMKWKNSILWGNSLFESLSNIEKDLKQYFGLFMFVIIRKIFKSGLYSSQDSIKMSHLWTRTIFELGLYSSQASNNDSTLDVLYQISFSVETQLQYLFWRVQNCSCELLDGIWRVLCSAILWA